MTDVADFSGLKKGVLAQSITVLARSVILRDLFALAMVALAVFLRSLLTVEVGRGLPTYITFYPAVMIAALLAGFWPGMLATVLSAIYAIIWLVPPYGVFAISNPVDAVGVSLFCGMGVLMSAIAYSYHRTREQAIAASEANREAQLATILENLSEGVIVSTIDGDIFQWNRFGWKMHGFASLEDARRKLPEFADLFELRTLDGKIITFEQWPLPRVLRGEKLRDWDVRIRRISTGAERILSHSGSLVYGIDDTPLMAVFTTTDVTERRKAEEDLRLFNVTLEQQVRERTTALLASNEALRQSEERARLMIESVKDFAIVMLDPGGHVTSWNIGAERIKGYRADEILGKSFTFFYTPEDNAIGKPQMELQQAMNEGRFEEEGWRVRKDGSRFWGSVIITPIYTAEGPLFGFVKITRDISERRRAEEESLRLNADLRRHAAALEVALKEMETFSYSVAHDLRSPLRSLDGFSKFLLEHTAARLDAQEQDYLQRMRAAAQRMARLIDDLLNLAHIGRTEKRMEQVDLSRLAAEIIAGLRQRDPARQVHADITPAMSAWGDRGLLSIALEHLLENAWKFTSTREEAHIAFGVTTHEGERVYVVRDNGVGFEMAYVDILFQPFQRLHTESEFPGTGIGLALAQRIIQRHGGRIWAEAVENQGATFYFTLAARDIELAP